MRVQMWKEAKEDAKRACHDASKAVKKEKNAQQVESMKAKLGLTERLA